MSERKTNQRIFVLLDGNLDRTLDGFITDRMSRGLSKRTIEFYKEKLSKLRKYFLKKEIVHLDEISASEIRQYLLMLSESRKKGGVHAHYRALRAFLNWWEKESDDYSNPIRKVSPPKVPTNQQKGIPIEDIMKMVDACDTRLAARDEAILLTLLDTGCRASEFLAINIGNLDLVNGEIEILHGKGDKHRTVYVGRNCRRKIRRYLKTRKDLYAHSPLWATFDECRLTYSGLRQIIRRRAGDAQIDAPGLHDFRRCFAIEYLRNDGDIFTLQKILGHASLEMVKRYLAIAKSDCEKAHRKASPVDRWNL